MEKDHLAVAASGRAQAHTPGRSFDQLARDLSELRKLAKLEKKQLGGITPRTASRFKAMCAEADALNAIDAAKATGGQP